MPKDPGRDHDPDLFHELADDFVLDARERIESLEEALLEIGPATPDRRSQLLVEAKRGTQCFAISRRGTFSQHDLDRVAGHQVYQQEHDTDHPQYHEACAGQSLQEVGQHRAALYL